MDRRARSWPKGDSCFSPTERRSNRSRSSDRPPGGKKLVVIGDTETIGGLADHVGGADLLVIEATFLERDAAMALDYGHLTAAKAARLAAENGVKKLILNHISGRYPDEEILAEARAIFPDSAVAADLDVVTV
jgi:ribonuclease Z